MRLACCRLVCIELYLFITLGILQVWDLDTQHCIQTVVGHRSEIWSVDYHPKLQRVITGTSDNQLRIWKVSQEGSSVEGDKEMTDGSVSNAAETIDQSLDLLHGLGSIKRHTTDRAAGVRFSQDGKHLSILGSGKSVEIYRVRTPEEMEKKRIRRERRRKEKLKAKGDTQEASTDSTIRAETKASDEFEFIGVIRSHHKLQSLQFMPVDAGVSLSNVAGKSKIKSLAKKGVIVLVSTKNNLVESHCLYQTKPQTEGGPSGFETVKISSINDPGHRSDIRSVTVSTDRTLMFSVDASQGKLWNCSTGSCIRTMDTGYGLCCGFGPANKHAIVGTKDGRVQLFDLASGDLVEEYTAHTGAVWSLDIRPDLRGLATAGADKTVKFWDFDLKEMDSEQSETPARQLVLTHSRTLKLSDEALCIRYSHHLAADELLIAVALLDSTVKVFYDDSLKFFLSLYGHKLPVMDMSISADNNLLVSASADKNVKIWGLDFGDCHKSIFAHDDSLTSVQFIANTHYFFTGSKDGTIKYWDGDRFERIHSLSGHAGEVWSLAVAQDGSFLLSSGHDRSIRIWKRTEEQVFLDEERDKEAERVMNQEEIEVEQAALDPSFADSAQQGGESKDDPYKTASLQDSGAAARPSSEAAKGAERLMEALQLARDAHKEWGDYLADLNSAEAGLSAEEKKKRERQLKNGEPVEPLVHPPKPSPFLIGKTPAMYILHTLKSLKPAEFEPALLMLSFTDALDLLKYLHHLLDQGLSVELCGRAAVFLVKLHQAQLTANISLARSMGSLKDVLLKRLRETKDVIGFNYAGLSLMKQQFEDEGQAVLAPDEQEQERATGDPGAKTVTYKKRRVQLL